VEWNVQTVPPLRQLGRRGFAATRAADRIHAHDRGVPQCGAEKHPLNLTQIMLA